MNAGLLGIYLRDHRAGAQAGVALARRLERQHAGTPSGPALAEIAQAIVNDRDELERMMARLGVRRSRTKETGALLLEYARRLKPNGRPLRRSPLTTLIELETLSLGVEGKACLWRTLQQLPSGAGGQSLDMASIAALETRAGQQRETLERLRLEAAKIVLRHGHQSGSSPAGTPTQI